MPCLDQDQNSIDCADPNCTYGDCTDQIQTGSLLAQVQAAQVGIPTGSVSPVAVSAGSSGSGGPGIISSILNFGSSVVNRVVQPSQSTSGLVLRINPTTGQQQYFNNATGQFVGGPVNSSGLGSLFGASGSGLILVVVAVAVAFFVFYRRK